MSVSDHTHSIGLSYNVSDATLQTMLTYPMSYQPKETKAMSTLAQVRAERKEARERARIEKLYTAWDESNLDSYETGAVMRFEWTPRTHPFTYAVLRADDGWFPTGQDRTGGKMTTEDLLVWLIDKGIGPDDVTWLT